MFLIGYGALRSAAEAARAINPGITIEPHVARLTAANASSLIANYDIVCDGTDNFATRYLVADACYFAQKPLVTAAVGTFDGTLTTIRAHERSAEAYVRGIREAVDAVVSGVIDPTPLYTHAVPLAELDRALTVLKTRPAGLMKGYVTP